MLEVEGVVRRFGEKAVLDGVSFHVEPGQAVVLTGPNGAGKTTLLRCVVGSDKPDAGAVRIDGRVVDESDPVVRAAMAVALDDVDFFPDLAVVEHLDLLARAHGVAEPEVVVDEVLEELGLEGAMAQLPVTLSSGQRQRLALASCLVRPRRLLVLDEPEQRLDVAGRRWLAERLRAEKAAGVAVLMACHDPELAGAVADRRVEVGR
ncbi:heme ABC exporter, ATP-binding protein CcmA [Streptoalloteichus tenebrarius]|uniref:Heme ABC exporter, ATP-binding protein CcmA n=1 Tax=Streptoalloteichus tenebrarius (strain ATCC 17920 / DSM 40477 / JCM 4838 / CBS 697.72 / NBRC 16177 / NCIMB 11028 / NRRL B-12390 / A12253. 1 / ISP 5477) TaxID=1933 RepID=A0ABT1I2Q4_STRSD|nr:ABC transporter ATP-binding protein [Streptoalloteichus tenebrarius]MCP2262072.1 heme ABC exporter, ATP-binding protein CcmA [Streptoalloteichus tenebrarius]BFF01289.1 ABC transporter ATP-binding protein [Streptoalloteichus tenebrarius]